MTTSPTTPPDHSHRDGDHAPLPSDALCSAVERPFRGRVFAYVATQDQHIIGAWRMSIVVDGESGHYPLINHFAYGSETDLRELADRLNRERLKLPRVTELALIGQSLRSDQTRRADLRVKTRAWWLERALREGDVMIGAGPLARDPTDS